MASKVAHIEIVRVQGNQHQKVKDLLAVEEPLEIRLIFGPEDNRTEKSLSVTMRTPGNDEELALGFLLSEGIINERKDVVQIRHCETVKDEAERGNVLKVHLSPSLAFEMKALDRHFYTSSSCGVCGKASMESVFQSTCYPLPPDTPKISAELIHAMPDKLREAQAVFEHTGGLHAAGLFDAEGKLLFMREDVGRHNALDKLIGAALHENMLPLSGHLIQVSGRTSFELVQKTLMAGAPVLSAVGAPSSLAAKLASDSGMTLLGFVRNSRFNVYCGEDRLIS